MNSWANTDTPADDLLTAIVNIYENNTDECNEWDSNDIVEEVAELLESAGLFKSCEEHGIYPRWYRECPRCIDEEEPPDDD